MKEKRKPILLGIGIVAGALGLLEAALWAGLSLSVPTFAKYWRGLAAQTPSQHALTYVVLGDSTGQGIGATSPGRSYAALLAKDLAKRSGRPVHIVNLSVSGARAQDVVDKQLPALRQMINPPDIVTMAIGANDVTRAFNEAAFRTVIDKICKDLPPNSYVADVPWFGARYASKNDTVLRAGNIIRERVQKHGLHQVNLKQATRVSNSPRMYAADLFHPSNHAYTVWKRAFWEAMLQSPPQTQP